MGCFMGGEGTVKIDWARYNDILRKLGFDGSFRELMCSHGFEPTFEGDRKWFDGRIDFANLDLTRCKEYEVNKGKLSVTAIRPARKKSVTVTTPNKKK